MGPRHLLILDIKLRMPRFLTADDLGPALAHEAATRAVRANLSGRGLVHVDPRCFPSLASLEVVDASRNAFGAGRLVASSLDPSDTSALSGIAQALADDGGGVLMEDGQGVVGAEGSSFLGFGELPNLAHLDLSKNGFTRLPGYVLVGGVTAGAPLLFPNLTVLNLSRNSLTQAALAAIAVTVPWLLSLDVSYNGLGALPPDMAGMTGLQALCLAGNGLGAGEGVDGSASSLAPVAFLSALAELDISHNRFTRFPDESGSGATETRRAGAQPFPALRILNMTGCPLPADADLMPLLRLPRLAELCLAATPAAVAALRAHALVRNPVPTTAGGLSSSTVEVPMQDTQGGSGWWEEGGDEGSSRPATVSVLAALARGDLDAACKAGGLELEERVGTLRVGPRGGAANAPAPRRVLTVLLAEPLKRQPLTATPVPTAPVPSSPAPAPTAASIRLPSTRRAPHRIPSVADIYAASTPGSVRTSTPSVYTVPSSGMRTLAAIRAGTASSGSKRPVVVKASVPAAERTLLPTYHALAQDVTAALDVGLTSPPARPHPLRTRAGQLYKAFEETGTLDAKQRATVASDLASCVAGLAGRCEEMTEASLPQRKVAAELPVVDEEALDTDLEEARASLAALQRVLLAVG